MNVEKALFKNCRESAKAPSPHRLISRLKYDYTFIVSLECFGLIQTKELVQIYIIKFIISLDNVENDRWICPKYTFRVSDQYKSITYDRFNHLLTINIIMGAELAIIDITLRRPIPQMSVKKFF